MALPKPARAPTPYRTAVTPVLNKPSSANVGGVDPRLVDIIEQAEAATGMRATVTPSGGAVRGARSSKSQHVHGNAIDITLFDSAGNPIPNYQNGPAFATYEKFAQTARAIQQQAYPDLNNNFRWGGYFGGGTGTYGALDLMHFDLAPTSRMAGGSWETGLTAAQRKIWPSAVSLGAKAIEGTPVQVASAGINYPMPTLRPSTAAATRPDRYAGTIAWDIPGFTGPATAYATGGIADPRSKGSAPYGTWPIQEYIPNTPKGLQGWTIGDSAAGTMPDPKYPGAPRDQMMIHLDAQNANDVNKILTAGCLGIPANQWPAFRDALQQAQQQFGPLVIELAASGQATIKPASAATTPPASAETFIATQAATPVGQQVQAVSARDRALAVAEQYPTLPASAAGFAPTDPQTPAAAAAATMGGVPVPMPRMRPRLSDQQGRPAGTPPIPPGDIPDPVSQSPEQARAWRLANTTGRPEVAVPEIPKGPANAAQMVFAAASGDKGRLAKEATQLQNWVAGLGDASPGPGETPETRTAAVRDYFAKIGQSALGGLIAENLRNNPSLAAAVPNTIALGFGIEKETGFRDQLLTPLLSKAYAQNIGEYRPMVGPGGVAPALAYTEPAGPPTLAPAASPSLAGLPNSATTMGIQPQRGVPFFANSAATMGIQPRSAPSRNGILDSLQSSAGGIVQGATDWLEGILSPRPATAVPTRSFAGLPNSSATMGIQPSQRPTASASPPRTSSAFDDRFNQGALSVYGGTPSDYSSYGAFGTPIRTVGVPSSGSSTSMPNTTASSATFYPPVYGGRMPNTTAGMSSTPMPKISTATVYPPVYGGRMPNTTAGMPLGAPSSSSSTYNPLSSANTGRVPQNQPGIGGVAQPKPIPTVGGYAGGGPTGGPPTVAPAKQEYIYVPQKPISKPTSVLNPAWTEWYNFTQANPETRALRGALPMPQQWIPGPPQIIQQPPIRQAVPVSPAPQVRQQQAAKPTSSGGSGYTGGGPTGSTPYYSSSSTQGGVTVGRNTSGQTTYVSGPSGTFSVNPSAGTYTSLTTGKTFSL